MHIEDEIPKKPCAWARWLLRTGDFVVWDTETTGLEDDSKIVSIAVVNQSGEILVDSLVNPGEQIPEEATWIHGITDEMVADAPTFEQLFPAIRRALINRRWVIYNSAYDTSRLVYECDRWNLLYPTPAGFLWGIHQHDGVDCAMLKYARHWGDWHDYFGDYRWQKLTDAARQQGIKIGGAHHALLDALTTLKLVQWMAISEDRKVDENGDV